MYSIHNKRILSLIKKKIKNFSIKQFMISNMNIDLDINQINYIMENFLTLAIKEKKYHLDII